jgi:predicted phosphoribosyltransferase
MVAKEIIEDLNRIADKVIVLYTPEPFGAVDVFIKTLLKLMTMK